MRNCKAALLELLQAGCLDLVFCNEEEAVTLAVELQLAPESGALGSAWAGGCSVAGRGGMHEA